MELIDLWILKHFASLTLLNWIYENIWFMEWIMTAIKNLYVWIKLKIVYGMWNFLVSYCLNFILLNMNIWTLLECWRYADHIDAWSHLKQGLFLWLHYSSSVIKEELIRLLILCTLPYAMLSPSETHVTCMILREMYTYKLQIKDFLGLY